MPSMDIFSGDAFSAISLTDAINEVKLRPTRIGQMNLFTTTSVATTTIMLERVGDVIQLVPPQPRGAPGTPKTTPKRSAQSIVVPHFPRPWAVYADEVQDVRAFGSETELEQVQAVVLSRMADNLADFDVTEEAARLGATAGVITYADGSTLDLFSLFGVSQAAEVDFDLDAASPASGVLRKACVKMIRDTRAALGGTPFEYVHAFVGDNFFDYLLAHTEVRETYKGWTDAQILRDSYVGKNRAENPIFAFGGIVFENYGDVSGSGVGVNTDKAQFFPVGAQNLFRTYQAPANYNETVNTLGKRLYAKQEPMKFDKGIEGEMQMNELNICTRPACLLRARRT